MIQPIHVIDFATRSPRMLGHWSLSLHSFGRSPDESSHLGFSVVKRKLIIGEKRNDLVLQPQRAELRRRKALSKK